MKQNGNIYSANPSISTRRNTIHDNEIDFFHSKKFNYLFIFYFYEYNIFRFEIELDLLLQTCDTIDHAVKAYLSERLLEMKNKQHSYFIHLSTAEVCFI